MKEYERISFGKYKNNPIVWRILKRDSDSLLLLSEYALDNMCFNDHYVEITWEDCSLRRWLNNNFLSLAFSHSERNMQMPMVVTLNRIQV